ncbi:MAG: type IV toxin-antitoxin system AbiEi family antitoxin, partial [bacterium]
LKQPQAINWNYRELAREAGVALGTVVWILTDLREMGFIRLAGPNLQTLVQGRDLLNRWEIGYAELLRPKLTIETCRLAGGSIEDLVTRIRQKSYPGEILIGGELGAALLTNQFRPARATLHINNVEAGEAMKILQLYPHVEGNVDLLQVFGNQNGWDEKQPKGVKLADPLLVHAELWRDSSERLHKIAELIFNKYLAPRIDHGQPE